MAKSERRDLTPEGLAEIRDKAAIDLAISGIFPAHERVPPRLWEELRIRLQRIYRRATGEPDAILTIKIGQSGEN